MTVAISATDGGRVRTAVAVPPEPPESPDPSGPSVVGVRRAVAGRLELGGDELVGNVDLDPFADERPPPPRWG